MEWRVVRLRQTAILLGTLLVVAIGVAIAARAVDLERAIETVRTAEPAVLALASAVYLVSWPLRGHRYGDVLAAVGHRCGTGFLTAAVFVSQAVNLVVPARAGDGVRAYLLNTRREVPYTTGVSSLAVERLFDLLSLATLGTGALVALALAGERGAGGDRFLACAGVVALVGVFGAGGNLAKILPLSQGGVGLYEAAFTALVVAVSPVGAATALAAAVLDHALKNLVTVAGGVAAALALNLSRGTLRPSEHTES